MQEGAGHTQQSLRIELEDRKGLGTPSSSLGTG